MKSVIAGAALVVATVFVGAAPVDAADVTPGVIFGSGNANGSFTVGTGGGVEIGLRGKNRFPAANQFNYDGTDTYTFPVGEGSPGRSIWNFEWSINTDFEGTTDLKLDDFTYLLSLDVDPTAAVSSVAFDPILTPDPGSGVLYWDHALGSNTTVATPSTGDGNKAADAAEYADDLMALNVAQNSWAYSFFIPSSLFDPNTPGIYTISLEAFFEGDGVASSSIDINVAPVPVPAALPLFLTGLLGLGVIARRRRKAVLA